MIGAPQFQPGEEAVLFLSASGPSIAHIFGLSQGLYRVKVDSRTGRRMVVPPVLTAIPNQTVNEGAVLTFTASATDPDIPANTLAFTLDPGIDLVRSFDVVDFVARNKARAGIDDGLEQIDT